MDSMYFMGSLKSPNVSVSHSVVPDSLRPHGLQPTRLLCPSDFSRQGYWSGLPFPSPGDLPNPGIEPGSPALQADSLPTELQGKPEVSKGLCKILSLCTFLEGDSWTVNQAKLRTTGFSARYKTTYLLKVPM